MHFSSRMHFLMKNVVGCRYGCGLTNMRRALRSIRYYSQTDPLVRPEAADGDPDKPRLPNVLGHPDYFEVSKLFTVSDLFNARVHFGHKEGSLDDRMKPYIFGSRLGHLVIDLEKTKELLTAALNVAAHIAYRDGIILFVSRSPQNAFLVEQTAVECAEFAHTRYWRPGMLTNSTMMFGAMTRLPDLIIMPSTLTTVLEQHLVVTEAAKMAIPVIGVVDTNCNPNLITYPVPGNDDTPCAISLYCSLFKAAILKGKAKRKEHISALNLPKPQTNN